MNDSLDKIFAEMAEVAGESAEWNWPVLIMEWANRLNDISRQHREELEFQVAITRELLPYQERAVKAEAALGEARELLRTQVDAHKCVLSLYRCDDEFISKQTSAAAAFLTRTSKDTQP